MTQRVLVPVCIQGAYSNVVLVLSCIRFHRTYVQKGVALSQESILGSSLVRVSNPALVLTGGAHTHKDDELGLLGGVLPLQKQEKKRKGQCH